MKKHLLTCFLFFSIFAFAEYETELAEGYKLRLGADLRARWEYFDRTVVSPEGETGPANQYLRMRTRAWMAVDIQDALTINFRLANRIHHVSSSPENPNNQGASTWKAPDEVYIDALNAVYKFNSNLTLTLGRQAISFGNGMIVADPTPFDQGRSAYTDGITLKYHDDINTVSLVVTYDSWKDRWFIINNKHRTLRSGNIFTAASYWTCSLSEVLKFDAYYFFNDVEDTHPDEAERNHQPNCNASLHTAGIRAFGNFTKMLDYSLEIAQQFGYNDTHDNNKGNLVDARVDFHTQALPDIKPVFALEYTHFSGDDANTNCNEGWVPLLAQAPLWGEELLPIMLNGNWTNLNLFKVAVTANPFSQIKTGLSVTDCYLDEVNDFDGRHLGVLCSANASYKYNDHLSFTFQFSHFTPGNAYKSGRNSFWGRFETIISL